MKKFLPFILIAIVIAQFFAPFSVGLGIKNDSGVTINKAEAADCKILEATISPETTIETSRPEQMTMQVMSNKDCLGKSVYIEITTFKDGGEDATELKTEKYLISSENFYFKFNTGENTCSGEACDHVWFKLIVSDEETKDGILFDFDKGPVEYKCTGKDTDGSIKCHTGTGNFNWGFSESNLNPLDSAVSYKDKYYYTKITSNTFLGEDQIEQSKPYDSKELCEVAREETNRTIFNNTTAGATTNITTTPCELYDENSELVTKVDRYYFEITENGETIRSGNFTTPESCKEHRDALNENKPEGITYSECKKLTVSQITSGSVDKKAPSNNSDLPVCTIIPPRIGGCIAQGLYYLFFKTTSFVFSLAGKILDFAVMYSISDDSYRSPFVVEGWGIVRDFCNMFFIFVLLYIAIGTILNLSSVKTKEMIINVVIIGLLINFSLFATQVIIDASNILTRVFYNPQTIVTGEKDPVTGIITSTPGDFGEIKLSEAIVTKVDPQNLIMKAREVNDIPIRGTYGGEDQETTKDGITTGTFILVVLLATAVNVVGLFVFITIAFIFIGRVIGLWLAMILAPIAFFSYTVPALQSIQMVGWKHWWSDTLKMAFMAPVFAFFMYLIVGFMDKGLGIIDVLNKNRTGVDLVVSIIVPFIFIMALLLKAKDITKSMSGQIGEAMASAGSKVGGLVVGAGLGGLAMAGRATVGRVADKLGNAEWTKKNRFTRAIGDAGKWTASKSFDVRATALGGQAGKALGADIGKAKEGGYTKHKEEVYEKRRARAESLKLGNMSSEVQALHEIEEQKAELANEVINDTTRIEGMLEAKRKLANDFTQKLTAANSKFAKLEIEFAAQADPNSTEAVAIKAKLEEAKNEADKAQEEFDNNHAIITAHSQERVDLNASTGKYSHKTGDGKVNKAGYEKYKEETLKKKGDFDNKTNNYNSDISNASTSAEKKINDAIQKAEAELIAAQNALKNTDPRNNADPKNLAEYTKNKENVTRAQNNFNSLSTSKIDDINKAKKAAKEKIDAELEKADKEYNDAKEPLEEMEKAVAKNGFAKEGEVRSLDHMSFKMIPAAHHHVEKINAQRIEKYAEEIRGRMFNSEANDKAAHEAKMRAEIKKH